MGKNRTYIVNHILYGVNMNTIGMQGGAVTNFTEAKKNLEGYFGQEIECY